MAIPFYAVYGHSELKLPASACGIFIWAQTAGSAGMSLVWAYLNDRYGSRVVIRAVSGLIVAVPVAAVVIPLVARALHISAGMSYLYAVVFLLTGATWGGAWMGFTNYVMELAGDDARPLFLGLQATLCAPTVAMPLLGGWLLSVFPKVGVAPYQTLFVLVALAGLVSMLSASRLTEPHPPEEAYR